MIDRVPDTNFEQYEPEAVDIVLSMVLWSLLRILGSKIGMQVDGQRLEILIQKLFILVVWTGNREPCNIG